jgi:hypothetical protein
VIALAVRDTPALPVLAVWAEAESAPQLHIESTAKSAQANP